MMAANTSIDIEALKKSIELEKLVSLIGVKLTRAGKEWQALCPFHNEKTPSFKITPAKQMFYCNGCGAGGDHINFVKEYYGLNFKDACKKLAELAGANVEPESGAGKKRASKKPEAEAPLWVPAELPSDAPAPPETLAVARAEKWVETPVVRRWLYRNADGSVAGYVCRVEFEKPDGTTGKDVIPITWQTNTKTGDSKWRQGSFPRPRPMYGVELLEQFPDFTIIVVEGEKACDSARIMLGDGVLVLTWPGGCKAVEHTDFTPLIGRKVIFWADCDSQRDGNGVMRDYIEQPGMKAMLRIAEILGDKSESRIIGVPNPDEIENGWDADDARAEGWSKEKAFAWIRERLRTPEETIAANRGFSFTLSEPESGGPVDAPESDISPLEAEMLAQYESQENSSGPENETAPPAAEDSGKKKERKKRKPPPSPDEVADKLPVEPLGYNQGRYYYLSHNQRQVHEYQTSNHTTNGLMQLAPLAYWASTFSYDGQMKAENWQSAVDALMRKCEKQGIFNTAIIRGRGCWTDEGRLVINLGNRVIVDSNSRPLNSIDSKFIYEAGTTLTGPSQQIMPVQEARTVIDLAKRFNWEMPGSAALLAGWIVLAPLCGALPWRPHIWLTGGSGTGKSTIIERFIAPLMAGMELQVQGNSTEAGIRQVLRADAKPVIFDESESSEEPDERRIQNVLALARQSSSESQSRTLKGTTSGKHLEFHIRSMFCLASIQVGIKRQADQTRIAVLGLYGNAQVAADDLEEHQNKWLTTEMMLADMEQKPDFSNRLMARSVSMYEIIRQNMKVLIRVAAKEFKSQRLADQYGTLLAGAATLMYDHIITETGALNFIRMFDWSTHLEAAKDDESSRALTNIMQIEVKVDFERGTENRTIGELIATVIDNQTTNGVSPPLAAIHLGRIGIKVKQGIVGKDAGVLVANNSDRLQKALRGQPWAIDWRSYLRRLPGAKIHKMSIRFSEGYVSRAIFIPQEVALPRNTE